MNVEEGVYSARIICIQWRLLLRINWIECRSNQEVLAMVDENPKFDKCSTKTEKMSGSCFKGRLLYAPFWNAEWRGGEVVEDRVLRYWTDEVQP